MSKTSVTQALVIGARDDGKGKRNIGGELVSRLRLPNWRTSVLTTSMSVIRDEGGQTEGAYDASKPEAFASVLHASSPHIVFVAIPTTDRGETAWQYVGPSLSFGAKVVTAEKGIAAWQFDRIDSSLDKIDLGAAVGGGNRTLYHPKLQYLRGRNVTLYGIFNATCSFLGWVLGEGVSPDDAIDQAQRRGIAEPAKPGTTLSLRSLINGEMSDIRMKTAAFYNKLLAENGNYLVPSDLGEVFLDEDDADRLISPHDKRRLLVTITNQAKDANHHRDTVGRMVAEKDGWHVSIGFVSLGTSPVADWITSVKDIDNGFLLYVDGHRFRDFGPGAGRVTVDAMLEGAYRLLGR
jgi:hypothetical protein